MQAATLRAVAGDWFGVLVVIVGTVVISLLGLVAGGASVIISLANELGADGRLVAFMQYLRVLVIVVLAPMVAYFVLYDGSSPAHTPVVGAAPAGLARDLVFTAGCALVGLLAARLLRVTAGALLGPLLLAASLSVSGLVDGAAVPGILELLAFAVIGLQVGLRFTFATIREARRLLAPALLAIVSLVVACALLALLLVELADVTYADAYLATTPGGLYAVLAASIGIGADTTFVVSVQVLRVFVIVLAAPPLIRLLARGSAPIGETSY
jgi:membrane AbrB-like protein